MHRLLPPKPLTTLATHWVVVLAFATAALGLCPCPQPAAAEAVDAAHACCTQGPPADEDCPIDDCPHCGEATPELLVAAAPAVAAPADLPPSFPVVEAADREQSTLVFATVRGFGGRGGPPAAPTLTLRAQFTLLRV